MFEGSVLFVGEMMFESYSVDKDRETEREDIIVYITVHLYRFYLIYNKIMLNNSDLQLAENYFRKLQCKMFT